MKTYVISDIHGEYDKFMDILKEIRFSESDKVYILGDVIDRGKKGIEILEYIMTQKNIFMIKGNHEYMMEQSFVEDGFRVDMQSENVLLWKQNGARPTLKTLLYRRDRREVKRIYDFIKALPLFYDNIEINGSIYYLVHGKPLGITKKAYVEFAEEIKEELKISLPTYEEYLVWERIG